MEFDLNINNYNFKETLRLFDLDSGCEIKFEDIKFAKSKVLSMHPDKSKLPSEYFIFYKRAFEIILQYYQCQPEVKIQKVINDKDKIYNYNIDDNQQVKQITEHLNGINANEFNNLFNQLYDDNMVDKEHAKKQKEKNKWFQEETPEIPDTKHNLMNINSNIELYKNKKKQGTICKYNEVNSDVHHFGSNIYDDGEENDYIYCNPSSKLLYDDLRKVHLNETVFNIGVSTTEPSLKFSNCDDLRTQRRIEETKRQTKEETDIYCKSLNDKKNYHQRLLEQNQNNIVQTKKYSLVNNKIISKFLRLSN